MRKLILALVSAAMIAGSTLAEPPTGSRLGQRNVSGLQYTEERADEESTKLAQCMVTKRGSAARGYVGALTQEEADQATGVLFKGISCMSFVGLSDMSDTAAFKIPRDIMRGKLAEALLNDKATIAALPALPLAKEFSRPWFAATGRDPLIDEMAVCVADTNPKGVSGILATRGYSKEEGAAFGAVMPGLSTCLRVGAKLQANRQALRAALADALYQRLTRPAPAVQAAAAQAATRKARLAFKAFAECVVKKRAQDARTYILNDLDEQQTARLRGKMLDDSCWQAAMGTRVPIVTTGLKLQGSLAEALMTAEPGSGGLLREIHAIAQLKHEPVTETEVRNVDPETLKFMEAMAMLFRWGECVIRADVAGSHGLLKSLPASADESQAQRTLKPAFEGCVERGRNLTASTVEMRAAVAVNYYRLAHAPRQATAQPKATR